MKGSYVEVTKYRYNTGPQWARKQRAVISTLQDFHGLDRFTYEEKELVDLYLYIDLKGNLGVVRRALVHNVLIRRKGRYGVKFQLSSVTKGWGGSDSVPEVERTLYN